MVQIGDRFFEKMPSWVGNGHEVFDWTYKVVGFKRETYGRFVQCIRVYKSGKREPVDIGEDLFLDETFYKKIA